MAAKIPTRIGCLILKGRYKFGSFFLKTIKEITTIKYAIEQEKVAEFTIQVNIVLPKKAEIIEMTVTKIIAKYGESYFLWTAEKRPGIRFASLIEYIALLPPIKNEFQEVSIPQRPPTIKIIDAFWLFKDFAIASAVTNPVSERLDAISAELNILPIASVTPV